MSTSHATSTGHTMSDAAWLDVHFNFAREAYEAMVRSVGVERGWHVLDAGCGGGSYLPWFAELVGSAGRLSALDLAPENIAAVEARAKATPLTCPVETRVGSVLALPYPNGTFDVVWSAAVSEYLPDDELRQMLSEFKRVLKPGGLVAIKENHIPGYYETFIDPLVMWRFYDALCKSGDLPWLGTIVRINDLPEWLRSAGYADVRRRFFAVEKYGPLNANDCQFRVSAYQFFATKALRLALPPADMKLWRGMADLLNANPFASRDYYLHGDYVLLVGRVP